MSREPIRYDLVVVVVRRVVAVVGEIDQRMKRWTSSVSAGFSAAIYQAQLHKKLRDSVSKHAVAAAEKSVSGADASQDIGLIEELQKIQALLPRSILSSDLRFAAALAALCLLLPTTLLFVPKQGTRMHLEITTGAVTMHLANDLEWKWEGEEAWRIGGPVASLGDVGFMDVAELMLAQQGSVDRSSTQPTWLMMTGPKSDIRLKSLCVPKDASLTVITNGRGIVNILTKNGPTRDQQTKCAKGSDALSIDGVVTVSAQGYSATHAQKYAAARVNFSDAGSIRASPTKQLQLRPVQTTDLNFFVPNREKPELLESKIDTGKIILEDLGQKVTREKDTGEKDAGEKDTEEMGSDEGRDLAMGDILQVENAEGKISGLAIGPKNIKLTFDGTVPWIKLGTHENEELLNPSWLEYLNHQGKLKFVWAAVVVLWGFGWGVRKLYSGVAS